MKKTILLLCACAMGYSAVAQTNDDAETRLVKNEISSNILDLVIAGSLNVTYERMLNNNISLAGSATFFDTYGYYDAGYLESTNAFSFRASANFYVSKRRQFEGLYFYPLLKVRTGEVTSDYDVFIYDDQGNFTQTNRRNYDVGGFSAGVGLGNKWVIQDKFTVSVFGEVARNLGGNLDRQNADLGNVEPRFGINFGYRF
ncbi:MAG: hypothetical protein NWQ09_10365 [Nonlabens sp.]|nr:hypothetical protein [Nonlabens sp.]